MSAVLLLNYKSNADEMWWLLNLPAQHTDDQGITITNGNLVYAEDLGLTAIFGKKEVADSLGLDNQLAAGLESIREYREPNFRVREYYARIVPADGGGGGSVAGKSLTGCANDILFLAYQNDQTDIVSVYDSNHSLDYWGICLPKILGGNDKIAACNINLYSTSGDYSKENDERQIADFELHNAKAAGLPYSTSNIKFALLVESKDEDHSALISKIGAYYSELLERVEDSHYVQSIIESKQFALVESQVEFLEQYRNRNSIPTDSEIFMELEKFVNEQKIDIVKKISTPDQEE